MFRGLLLFAVLGLYFISTISQAGDVVESPVSDSVVGPDFAVFCQVAKDQWRRVINHNDKGVNVLPQAITFEDAWNHDLTVPIATLPENHEAIQWSNLRCPLPDPHVDTWGYAMTYPSHQKEVRLEDVFHFRKFGPAVGANSNILFRPHLDYESEIGILMQRGNSHRFGYILVNDWTDRGIQVRTYDAGNMAPGFTAAKSFKDALHVGYLLVVGNAAVWEKLEIELRINGEKRQHLIARDCFIRPGQVFTKIFNEKDAGEWAFVATGTTGGVQFQSPTIWQKIGLMMTSGFSKKEAIDRWLAQLSFLQPGDRIEFYSTMLGHSRATVVREKKNDANS
ncbi:MAG: fumarylacetoacetate hydrolase family protein [Planctomycetota bacterium]